MEKPLNTTGVILCTCKGKISKQIDLEKILLSLQGKSANLLIAEKLCEDWSPLENLAAQAKLCGLVLGACSEEALLSNLGEKLTSAGVDEFSVSTFDLLGQCFSSLDKTAKTPQAMTLLKGLVEKGKRYPGTTTDNLKPFWFKGGDKISRRQLFSLPRVKYALVPSLDKQRCVAWKGCRLCFTSCPLDAFIEEEGLVKIDKDRCSGCGACLSQCPTQAIVYPGFTMIELEAQLKEVLHQDTNEDARTIIFVCPPLQNRWQVLRNEGPFTSKLMPIYLPCLALVSPYLILRALSLGASAVLLLSCVEGCPKGIEPEKIKSNAKTAQALVEALGIKDVVVHYVGSDSNKDMLEKMELVSAQSKSPTLLLPDAKDGETKGNPGFLLALLAEKLKMKGGSDMAGSRLPLGKVKIDPEKCSLCELCSSHCPTGALMLEEKEDITRLLFNYRDCIACNLCLKYCPERKIGAIKVERVLDWELLANSREVLIESRQVLCSKCGAPLGTSLLLERVRGRLGGMAKTSFSLCSHCRFKEALFRDSDKKQEITEQSV